MFIPPRCRARFDITSSVKRRRLNLQLPLASRSGAAAAAESISAKSVGLSDVGLRLKRPPPIPDFFGAETPGVGETTDGAGGDGDGAAGLSQRIKSSSSTPLRSVEGVRRSASFSGKASALSFGSCGIRIVVDGAFPMRSMISSNRAISTAESRVFFGCFTPLGRPLKSSVVSFRAATTTIAPKATFSIPMVGRAGEVS